MHFEYRDGDSLNRHASVAFVHVFLKFITVVDVRYEDKGNFGGHFGTLVTSVSVGVGAIFAESL
eukprot:4514557-Amphidinium_carterae.1